MKFRKKRKKAIKLCWYCETPIHDARDVHRECFFANVAGHQVKCCRCCPPPDGRGQWANDREMALAAWSRRALLDD